MVSVSAEPALILKYSTIFSIVAPVPAFQIMLIVITEMNFIFCGFYLCVIFGKSIPTLLKPGFISLWVICRNINIDRIHKNNNSFLIIRTLSSKCYKLCQKWQFWDDGRKKDPTDSCFELYCSVKPSTSRTGRNVYEDEKLEFYKQDGHDDPGSLTWSILYNWNGL